MRVYISSNDMFLLLIILAKRILYIRWKNDAPICRTRNYPIPIYKHTLKQPIYTSIRIVPAQGGTIYGCVNRAKNSSFTPPPLLAVVYLISLENRHTESVSHK